MDYGKEGKNKLNSNFEKIDCKIFKNIISPVYLLFGEEEFLIKQFLQFLIDKIITEEEKSFNLEFIDGSTTNPADIISSANTYPFLGNKKIIVIQNYPALLNKSQSDFSFNDIFEKFNKGEYEKSVKLLLDYLELKFSDVQIMSKYEFTSHFKDTDNNSLSEHDQEIIEKIFSYINEKTDSTAAPEEISSNDMIFDFISSEIPDFLSIIFTSSSTVKKSSPLYKLINKKGEVLEFSIDKKNQDFYLVEIQKFCKEKGITITPNAEKKLTEKTGLNLRQIYKEIEKITVFLGEKKIIEEKDIDSLVTRFETEKVYELSDALAERKKDKAIMILNRILKDDVHHLQIMGIITNRFRFLLQCKLLIENGYFSPTNSYPFFSKTIYPDLKEKTEKILPSERNLNIMKQHPFVVFKTIQQSALFTLSELKTSSKKILEWDKQLKLSSQSPKIILEQLIIDIT